MILKNIARSSLSPIGKLLGLSRTTPAYQARPQISPFKRCSQSVLAPLGSAKGFPFLVSIPALMVIQEGGFPLILVSASLGNINKLQGCELPP